MNSISKTEEDLIYLVSCAVNSRQPELQRCSDMDMDGIYTLAKAHSLASAAAIALEKTVPLTHDFDQAKKKVLRKTALFDIERAVIFRELEERGIRYLPLKGIILKDYYPRNGMREMSDNDILFESSKSAEIKAIMENLGYTCTEYGGVAHDVYAKPPTLEFEFHRNLFTPDALPEMYAYYRGIGNKLIKDEGSQYRYRLSNEDFYIYILCHLYKHYISAGTGLRSLLDIYLFNKKFSDSLDREYIKTELDKLKIQSFEVNVRSLSEKIFTGQPLTEEELTELRYYISSGTHGKEQHLVDNLLQRELSKDESKNPRQRYLFSRIFISGESLKNNYPFVYKHKLLYPFLIVYRPVKGLFTHPKGILTEILAVNKFSKTNHRNKY